MKILHIAPTPFFADRGCHMRILGEIRALQSLGHEVLLTTYHNGRDVEGINTKRVINITWYKKLEAGASWHKLYLDILLLWTSIRGCMREKPDVIHGHLHEGALIGKLVSILLSKGKVPVIFDLQGSLTGELITYGFLEKSRTLKAIFSCLEKLICRLPDYIVCSSESNKQFVKLNMSIAPERVRLLPDGIQSNFFTQKASNRLKQKLGMLPDRKVVIFTGSLMPSKGIDYLLDAIPTIIRKYELVHFLVVGYPIQPSKDKVRYLEIQNFVHFTGKIEYFQLPEYLALADVAVDPKVDEAGEGSGKIINYMGAGLPIVCFDTLNNRALIGNSGFFASSGDSEDLGNKIVEALESDILSKAFGEQNRRRIDERFSWDRNGEILSEVYTNAMYKDNRHGGIGIRRSV